MISGVVVWLWRGEGKLLGDWRGGLHRLSILVRKEYARATTAKAVSCRPMLANNLGLNNANSRSLVIFQLHRDCISRSPMPRCPPRPGQNCSFDKKKSALLHAACLYETVSTITLGRAPRIGEVWRHCSAKIKVGCARNSRTEPIIVVFACRVAALASISRTDGLKFNYILPVSTVMNDIGFLQRLQHSL